MTITSNSVQIVIRNQGNTPVTDPFWVDLYIDPSPPPTGVNQIWNSLSSHGAVWGVVAPALPLEPGESFNLTYDDTYYWKSYSNISWPLSEGTPVYVQVDSANANTTYGGVLENHEMEGGAYNNVSRPVLSTLNTMGEKPAAHTWLTTAAHACTTSNFNFFVSVSGICRRLYRSVHPIRPGRAMDCRPVAR